MRDIIQIAKDADMIINGYAFSAEGASIRILNLNDPQCAAVLTRSGDVLETTMDDIELKIVQDYLESDLKYMEVGNA